MGMFSWVCKGCGEDLKMDELVRIAGVKGTYDGYGRVDDAEFGGMGSFPCWHQYCYDKASDKQKLDETPSASAENQGFGYPYLKYMEPHEVTGYALLAERLELHERKGEDKPTAHIFTHHEYEYKYTKAGKFIRSEFDKEPERFLEIKTLVEALEIIEKELDNFANIKIITFPAMAIKKEFVNKTRTEELKKWKAGSRERLMQARKVWEAEREKEENK
jgi:hypothetical protein